MKMKTAMNSVKMIFSVWFTFGKEEMLGTWAGSRLLLGDYLIFQKLNLLSRNKYCQLIFVFTSNS